MEVLESRIAPATLVTWNGSTVSVQGDNTGAGETETLQIFVDGSNFLHVLDAAHAVTTDGSFSIVSGNEVKLDITGLNFDLALDTKVGASDTVSFTSALTVTGHATLTTEGSLTFADSFTLSANKSLTAVAGSTIALTTSASDLAASGTGAISLTTARDIALSSGSSVTTANGNLTLSANAAGTATGYLLGVVIDGGTVQTTGSGTLSVTGHGGDYSGSPFTTGSQYGVYLVNSGKIIGGTSGSVNVTGVGGASTDWLNRGITLYGAGSDITSNGANISVIGTGGSAGTYYNIGISLLGGKIAATGAGTVTVNGTGGGLYSANTGVEIGSGANSISAASGNITITSTAGGGGSSGLTLDSSSITTSSGGNITFISDSLVFANGAAVNAGPSTVTLKQKTAGVAIGLGGADSAGILGLADDELDFVTAGTIQIGDSNTGAITVSSAISHTNANAIILTAGTGQSINLNADFTTASGPVTFSNPVSLGATATVDTTNAGGSTGAAIAFNSTLNGASALTLRSGSGNLTFSGAVGGSTPLTGLTVTSAADVNATSIALASGSALSITHTGTASTVSGAISGTNVTLTKAGSGTLTLGSTGSYSGATSITGGTLILQADSASPSFAIGSGATLDLNVASGTTVYSTDTNFTGTGTLKKSGSGTAAWASSAATFALGSGALIDIQGGVFLGGNGANEVWTSNLASLNVASGATFNSVEANVRVDKITGSGTIASGYSGAGYTAMTFGVDGGSSTFNGTLADNGGFVAAFTKAGAGTIILAANSSYTGATTISGGTLQIGNGGTTGSLGSGSVSNSGTLVFNRSNAFSVANNISGSGALTVTNSGGATFSGTVSQGTVTLTATTGTIAFTNDFTATTLTTANAGYNVSLTGTNTSVTNDVNFLNTGSVTLGNGTGDTLTFAGGLATTGNGSNPSSTSVAGTIRTNGQALDLGATTLTTATTLQTNNTVAAGAGLSVGAITGSSFALTLNAGTGGAIALNGAASLSALTTTSSTIGSLPALTIGAGGLSITTTGGGIAQSGAITVSGTTTFAVGSANNITLGNTSNDFASVTISSANNVSLTDTNAITLNASTVSGTLGVTAAGITVGGALTLGGDTTFTSSAGIAINAALTLATDKNLTATASGTSTGLSVGAAGSVTATGIGAISLTTARDLVVSSGATISVVNGAMTLSANQQGLATTGTFNGLLTQGTLTTSGTGNINLSGRSGTTSSGATDDDGVTIQGLVRSTLAGATAGDIIVSGTSNTGGADANAEGVTFTASGSIQTVGGDISITGTGSAGTGTNNDGVLTVPGSISSTGSGTITITGIARAGTAVGVRLNTSGDSISSNSGSISITGTGVNDSDIQLKTGTSLSSTSGNITLTGNSMDVQGTITSGATVSLVQRTAGTVINLGTETAGQLSLTDAELDRISGAAVQIGNSSSGALTVSSAISHTNTNAITLTAGTGQSINLNANFVTAGGPLTFSNNLALGASATVDTTNAGAVPAGAAITASGTIALGANTLTWNSGATNTSFGSTLSGTGGLTKLGSGTFTLSGTGIGYSGATSVQAGRLKLSDTSNFVSSVDIQAAGTLEANSTITNDGVGVDWYYREVLSGAGTFRKTGSGDFAIGGPSNDGVVTMSGQIYVEAGRLHNESLQANWTGSTANIDVAAGATLDLRGQDIYVNSLTGGGTVTNSYGVGGVAQNLRVGVANGSGTFSGVIQGSGSGVGDANGITGLIKSGSGTLTLSGTSANTFSGATSINAGVLVLSKTAGVNAIAGNITVGDGAGTDELDLGASNQIADTSVVTFNSGTGGNNARWHMLGFDETVAGIATASGGTLPLIQAFESGGSGTSTLTINNSADYVYDGIIRSNSGGSTTLVLVKNGSGTLTLQSTVFSGGGITYTGATTISGGKIIYDNLTGLGTASITVNSATAGALTFNQTTNNLTLSAPIGGSGSLAKTGSGTLTLNGSSSFSGNVAVNAGTVKVGNSNAFGASNTAVTKVVVASGAAVDFNGQIDATYGYTISGTGVGGTGALTNTGAAIGVGYKQATNIKLAADATIGGSADWGLIGSGYGVTSLDLNGFTLTKSGANTIAFANTTTTAGNFAINQGGVNFFVASNAAATAFTLANTAGVSLTVGANLSTGSISGGGSTGGGISIASSTTLTTGALNSTTSYAGIISGSGALTKTGSGSLTLSGTNTFSGITTISGGKIIAGSSTALGSSSGYTDVQSGGTLDINGQNLGAEPVRIAGTGVGGLGALVNNGSTQANALRFLTLTANATVGGTGRFDLRTNGGGETLDLAGFTLTKEGSNQFSVVSATITNGNVTANAGIFSLESGTVAQGTGTFTYNAGASAVFYQTTAANITRPMVWNGNSVDNTGGDAGINSPITLGGNVSINNGSGNFTLGGAIGETGGARGITKTGSGALTLSSTSNSYSGDTTISAGTLKLGASGVIPDGTAKGNVIVNGTLDLNGFSETINGLSGSGIVDNSIGGGPFTLTAGSNDQTSTFSGVIKNSAGSLALTKTGTGTLTLSGSSANTFSGTTTINDGILLLSKTAGVNAIAGNITIGNTVNSDVLQLGASDQIADSSVLTFTSGGAGHSAKFILGGFSETIGGITTTGSGTAAVIQAFETGGTAVTSTLTINNSADYIYDGLIRDAAGGLGALALVKTGAGSLTLRDAFSSLGTIYSGSTTISNGKLVIDNLAAFASAITNNSATADALTFNQSSNALTYSATISGTGALTKTGAAALALSGANTYTGATTVNGGTLAAGIASVANTSGAFGNNSAVTLANTSGVVLDITGFNTQIGSLAGGGASGGNVTLGAATLTVGASNTSTSYSGAISGTGALTKIGSGTLTLNGASSYSGTTTVSAGTLQLGNGSALGTAAGGTTISSGATLDLNGQTIAEPLTPSGTGVGGNGALINASGTAASVSGTISSTGGTSFTVGGAGDITVQTVASTNSTSFTLTKLGAGILTLSGTADNAFLNVSANAGTVRLAKSIGSAHAADNVTINGGTVTITGSGGDQINNALTVNSGTFDLGAFGEAVQSISLVSGSITGTTGVFSSTGTFSVSSGSISAIIGGSVGPTKITGGTVTLSGTNTFTGGTTVAAGTLVLGNNSALGATSSLLTVSGGTVDLAGFSPTIGGISDGSGFTGTGTGGTITTTSGTPTLTSSSNSRSFGGTITGAVNITMTGGSGYQIFNGNNTYTGLTTINSQLEIWNVNALGGTSAGQGTVVNSGGSLVLNGATDNLSFAAEPLTINGTGTLSLTTDASLKNATFAGPITLSSGANAAITGGSAAGTLTLSGAITGAGGLNKNSSAVAVILSNTGNSYAGDTTITAGTLKLGAAGVIPDGAGKGNLSVTGTLDLNGFSETINGLSGGGTVDSTVSGTPVLTVGANNATSSFSGTIKNTAGTTTLTKTGTGTLTLSGASTYSGATNVDAGSLTLSSGANRLPSGTNVTLGGNAANTSATLDLNGQDQTIGTLTLGKTGGNGAGIVTTGAGTLTLGGALSTANTSVTATHTISGKLNLGGATRTFTVVNATPSFDLSIDAVISNGGITKSGAGTLVLSGANTFDGAVLVSQGVLNIQSATALGSTVGSTSVSSGATLQLQGGITVSNEGLSLPNHTSAFALENVSGSNTWTGAISADTSVGVNTTRIVSTAGNLTISGNITTSGTAPLVLQGAGNGEVSGDISGSAALTKSSTGAGTWILSGTNSYSGATTISNGTLQIGNGGTTGTLGSGSVNNDASLVFNRTNSLTVGNAISGSGSVTQSGSGTTILTGSNSYGTTTISAGTLQIGSGSTTGSLGSGAVTNNSALVFNRSNPMTVGVAIGGTGTVTQAGGGTTTLSVANSYTGTTSVNAGTLLVTGSLANGPAATDVTVASGATLGGTGTIAGAISVSGTLAPGTSPGALATGGVSFTSGGVLAIEINGTTAGSGYDQLNATGNVDLSGATLTVTGTYAPVSGNSFTILTATGTVSNTFTGLPAGTDVFLNGKPLEVLYNSGSVVLSFDATPTIEGTAGADTFNISKDGSGNIVVTRGVSTILSAPQASLTNLTINANDGNDATTIDYSAAGGFFTLPIFVNGGNHTGAPGDSLTITGGTATTITHTLSNASDGSINIDGTLITFTGIEPIADNASATNRVFTFNGGAETIGFTSAGAGLTKIDSTLGESITFANSATSLVINANTGADTVNITSFGPGYAGSLTINTDGGDTASLASGLPTLTSVALTAATIKLNSLTTTGTQTYTGAVTLQSSTSLSTTNSAVTFTSTIDGTAANTQSLTINAGSGAISFASGVTGQIGGTTPLLDLTTSSGSAALSLPLLTIGGNLSITTSGGSISQSGLAIVAGTSSFTAGAASISLLSANQLTGAVSLSNSGGNSVSLVDTLALSIASVNVGSGTLALTGAGITQTGAITQAAGAGLVTLTGGSGAIVLGAANNFVGTVNATTTGSAAGISINDNSGGLTVGIITTTDGAISLSAASGALNAGTVTAGGTSRNLSLTTTTSGNIAFNNLTAAGDTITITSAGSIQESGADAGADLTASTLTLSAASGIGSSGAIETAASNLSATTTSGGINLANTGALAVTGLSATSGNIILANIGALTTSGAVTATSGTVTLSAASPVTVGANVTASGDISISAGETSDNGVWADDLTVNASVAISSTGGSVTLQAGDDIIISSGATIGSSTTTTLTAAFGDSDLAGTIQLNGAITAGGTATLSARGNIALDASVTSTGGDVSVTSNVADITRTAGTLSGSTITLSGATGVGASGAAIQTAGATVNFASTTGDVFITESNGAAIGGTSTSGNVTATTTTGNWAVNSIVTGGNVFLTATAGAITDNNGASTNVDAAGFVAIASTGIGAGNALETIVANFEAQTSTGGVSISELNTLTIGGVNGTTGVSSTTSGDVTISTGGALTIAENITVSSSATVTLSAVGTITETTGAVKNATRLNTTSVGGETLTGANTVASFNATNTAGGGISLTNTAATLTLVSVTNTAAGAGLLVNNTGGIQLGDSSNLNINIGNIAAITASGAITDGNTTANNITAIAAVLAAGSGIGTNAERIETNISNLEASAGTGGLYITETDGLTIGSIGATVGVSAGADISISSADLTLNEDVASSGGNVTLNAVGAITETSGRISGATLTTTSVNGQALGNANTVTTFNATNTTNGSVSLVNTAATLTITGISNTTGATTTSVSNTGSIVLNGDVTATAGSGDVSLSATGSITRTTGTITGDDLTIVGTTGIGQSSSRILTAVTSITATSTDADQYFTESNGLTALNINAGTGSVTLTLTAGSVTDTDASTDIAAGAVSITTSASGSDIGSNAVPLHTAATSIAFSASGAGSVYLTEADDVSLSGSTGSGTITVTSTTGDITLNGLTTSGDVTLTAGGSLTQSSGVITADTADLNATDAVGTLTTPVQVAINRLDGSSGSGGFFVTDTSTLTIDDIAGGTGDIKIVSGAAQTIAGAITTTADVTLVATAGTIIETTGRIDGHKLTTTSKGGLTLDGANTVDVFTATNTTASGASNVSLLNTANDFSIETVSNQTGGTINIVNTGSNASIDGAITSGGSVNGGAILVQTGGLLTVDASVSTSTGSGGTLTLGGNVHLNSSPMVGAGNITLQGGTGELTINAAITVATALTLQSTSDVNILAKVETLGANNITVLADSDGDGEGGVLIATDTSAGMLKSGGNLDIRGSEYSGTSDGSIANQRNSVIIQSNGLTSRLDAIGSIFIKNNAAAPADARIWLGGLITDNTTRLGDITFDSPVLVTHSDARIITHNFSDIYFNGAIDSDAAAGAPFNLRASLENGVINFNAIVGDDNPLGDVLIDTALDVNTAASFTARSFKITNASRNVVIGAPLNVTGSGTNLDITTVSFRNAGSITGAAGDMVITTNSISLDNTIGGTGTLLLQPISTTRTVGINGAGDFELSDNECDNILAGFTQVTIGRSNSTAAVDVGSLGPVTFHSSTLIRSPLGAGKITVNDQIFADTADAGIALTAPTLRFDVAAPTAAILTTSGDITLTGAVTLLADTTFDARGTGGGGSAKFEQVGSINGAFNLVINAGAAGTANLFGREIVSPVGGSIGGSTPLTSLEVDALTINLKPTIQTTGDQQYYGTTHLLNGPLKALRTGSIEFHGPVVSHSVNYIYTTTDDIIFHDTLDGSADGVGTLTLTTTTGNVTLDGVVGGTHPLNSIAATSKGSLTINADLNVAGPLRFNVPNTTFSGAHNLISADSVSLTSSNTLALKSISAVGEIRIQASEIDFAPGSTVDGSSISLFPYSPSATITVGGSSTTAGLDLTATDLAAFADGFSSITIGGVTQSGAITVAAGTSFSDPVTIQAPAKAGRITVSGALSGTGDATLTLLSPATRLNGNVSTDHTNITIGGAIVGADITVSSIVGSGSGLGNITFTTGVQNDSTTRHDLTITAGSGNITAASFIGASARPFDAVVANSAGATLFKGAIVANSVETDAAGTTQFNAGVTTKTAAGQHYRDDVIIGGATTFNSATGNGTIAFDKTIENVAGAGRALTITSGSGVITFASTIGAVNPLGSLSITTANNFSNGGLRWNVGGLLSVRVGVTHDLTITGSQNSFGSVQLVADDATIVANSDIVLAGATIHGTLNLTTTNGGDVAQSRDVSISQLVVNSDGAITLNRSLNTIQKLGSLTANGAIIVVQSGSTLRLMGDITTTLGTAGDNVIIVANGFNSKRNMIVDAGVDIDAGGGDYLLYTYKLGLSPGVPTVAEGGVRYPDRGITPGSKVLYVIA